MTLPRDCGLAGLFLFACSKSTKVHQWERVALYWAIPPELAWAAWRQRASRLYKHQEEAEALKSKRVSLLRFVS